MTEKEVLQKWNEGLGKHQIAIMYRRQYNEQIRRNRMSPRTRYSRKIY